MTTRQEVYEAIDTEREYQDRVWKDHAGGTESPNPLSIGEWILCMEEYLAEARVEWTGEPKPEVKTLETIRKVGAIAVHCMEQHGAPKR